MAGKAKCWLESAKIPDVLVKNAMKSLARRKSNGKWKKRK